MRTITIGVDLAKQVFSTCPVDAAGRVQDRRELRREAFSHWLPNVPAGTAVAMEACSSAHHWARRCESYGLRPRLMAAQFVAPVRKSRTAKNDRNDAEAIATAARQGNMATDLRVKPNRERIRPQCVSAAGSGPWFQVSYTHFQEPSDCRRHTVMPRPVSVTRLPSGPGIVIVLSAVV